MRIDLIYPVLPPTLDGIGDYTAHMAEALAEKGADVRVLTGHGPFAPLKNVTVVPTFSTAPRRGIRALADAVAARPPDWLVLQFEQFSYGRWGLNPFLPLVLKQIKQAHPGTRLALMAHEDFVSAQESPQFAVMSLWQRPQFWALGHLADHVFLSIDAWAQRYQRWFPQIPVQHLPVGSNIPRVPLSQRTAREQLQLPSDAFLIGLFGGAHPTRQFDRIGAALARARSLRDDVGALYVGSAGEAARCALPPDVPLYDMGPRPAAEVSACFAAMDLYLAPFKDGVSTRRGSFLVGLQHAVPTISTSGPETDRMLLDENETSVVLVPWQDEAAFCAATERLLLSPPVHSRLAHSGGRFFDKMFAWPRLATRLLTALSEAHVSLPHPADGVPTSAPVPSPTPSD